MGGGRSTTRRVADNYEFKWKSDEYPTPYSFVSLFKIRETWMWHEFAGGMSKYTEMFDAVRYVADEWDPHLAFSLFPPGYLR